MRTLGVIVGLVVLLIVGGALTAFFAGDGGLNDILPTLQQTNNASGSTLEVEPYQAEQFFLLVGFLLFNLIGIGATLAVIFWFLNRGIKESQAETKEDK